MLGGWAGPELLDSYQAEWRPVGARRAARSAQEGPEPDGVEALAEDLNGRLAHAWLGDGKGRVSTLDLLGPGLTLLAGPDGHPWILAARTLVTAAPLAVRRLDRQAAATVGITDGGAVLVRPDAQVVATWPAAPADPQSRPGRAGR